MMNDNSLSALDRALRSGGAGRVKSGFAAVAGADREKALWLLEDERLQFPAFFTVLPEIDGYGLTGGLGPRNLAAAAVCGNKLGLGGTTGAGLGDYDPQTVYGALRWMFDTGKGWEAGSASRDGFEAMLDYAAALLVISFEDTSVLTDIARLIFRRNRQGRLIHDLVWCFFQTLEHGALSYVAGQLLSQDRRDAALAAKLLGLELPGATDRTGTRALHREYMEWLDENGPYLYVTGEHFQQSSRPKHLGADPEAKYLGRELHPRYRAPVTPLSDGERASLRNYRLLPAEEQELLAMYSHRLRRSDARAWEAWLQQQAAEQVFAARSGGEAL